MGGVDYVLSGCTFSTPILRALRGNRLVFLRNAQSG
jgi:hypothetical protein